jgi:hypothetical protein
MAFDFLRILLPLMLLIAGGYVLSRVFSLSEGPLVRVVTDFFMPLLVFYSFCTTRLELSEIVKLIGVVTLVVGAMLVCVWLYSRAFKLDLRSLAPPLLFMNSGFLGIPVMKLWGGLAAMNLIIIYDQIQTFYIFTLGIIIVTGSYRASGLKEMIRSPLVWAILFGFAFNLAEINVHPTLLDAMKFSGEAAPSLATFTIGMTLNHYRVSLSRHVIAGVLMRIGLGFIAGTVAAMLFGFTGMAAVVVVVASSLPSAVFSVVLTVRYGAGGQYAGSVLISSTLLSLVALPFLFQAAQTIFG